MTTSLKIVEPAAQRQSIDNVTGSTLDTDGTTTEPVANHDAAPTPQPTTTAPSTSSATAVTVVYVPYPGDCCPKTCRWKYWCWDGFLRTIVGDKWWTYRCYCKRLVDHRYFESFIIFMIMTSSVSLVNIRRNDTCRSIPSSQRLFLIRTPVQIALTRRYLLISHL